MAIWVRPCVWHRRSPEVEDAPFRADLAEGPEGARAVWRTTTDGVRLRIAWWPVDDCRGTVLLFPGRTEHIEKYGRIACDLTSAGFTLLTIDWRGQGFSDRVADDPMLGHVVRFLHFQTDVQALIALAIEADMPKPWHLIAHSMGGCIGLRALINGLDVRRAVFSAPMWGIQMPAPVRALPYVIPPVARALRMENRFAPGTKAANYFFETEFQDNMLTGDPETYAWLRKHAAVPEFALGGPSIQWVGEATTECNALANLPRPALPVRTYVGTEEAIVSGQAIRRMHANWPSAELTIVKDARHEIMMETDATRRRFIDETLAFFGENET